MNTKLGRVVIPVEDYDKAFDFYQQNFLCKKLYDTTLPDGKRCLHIAFTQDDAVGIWLLKTDKGDHKIEKTTAIENQLTLIVYTDDIAQLYKHVHKNGVIIVGDLMATLESQYFHCLDLYGNKLTIVELNDAPIPMVL